MSVYSQSVSTFPTTCSGRLLYTGTVLGKNDLSHCMVQRPVARRGSSIGTLSVQFTSIGVGVPMIQVPVKNSTALTIKQDSGVYMIVSRKWLNQEFN